MKTIITVILTAAALQCGAAETKKQFDSKEELPQFRAVIEEVAELVREEMKKDGSYGKFGSCHHFWRLKKEKLLERGILWRSPAELNPGTNFD